MCKEGTCGECRMKRWNERYLKDRFGYENQLSLNEMIKQADSFEDISVLEDVLKDVDLDEYHEFNLKTDLNKKRYLFE